jgi:hypothetical protein
MVAVLRYERINYEYKMILETLEKAKIAFIPLKGSVIRDYYPEAWMRTSCDIDILVHESELDRAIGEFTEIGFKYGQRGTHDVSLYSPGGITLELHFDLVEEGRVNGCRDILDRVWDYASVKDGYEYQYELDAPMFWFYHIAHMAKHFEVGGCGIRPFLDMWILENKVDHDKEKRNALLEAGGLLKFSECCEKLSRVWFDGEDADEVSRALGQYILRGGVYGSIENRVAAQQTKKGGRVRYFMSRLFLPYRDMKIIYPILQKHKWLLPFMEVRRWCRLVFKGRTKTSMRELEFNRSMSREQIEKTEALLRDIGL